MTSTLQQQQLETLLHKQQTDKSPNLQLILESYLPHLEKQLIKTKEDYLKEGGLIDQPLIEEEKEVVLKQSGEFQPQFKEVPRENICVQDYSHIRALIPQSTHRVLRKERYQWTGRMIFPMEKLRPARIYSTFPSLGSRIGKQRISVVPQGREMLYFLHTLRLGLQEHLNQLQFLPKVLVIFVNFFVCERKHVRALIQSLKRQVDNLRGTEIAVVTDRQELSQNQEAVRQIDQTVHRDGYSVLYSQVGIDSTTIKRLVKEYLERIRQIGEGYDLTENDNHFFPQQAELTQLDEELSSDDQLYWEQQERPAEQICFGLFDFVEELSFEDDFLFWEQQERPPVQRHNDLMPYDDDERRTFLQLA